MHWQILGRTGNTRAAALVGKHLASIPSPSARLPVGTQVTSCQGGSHNTIPGLGGISLVGGEGVIVWYLLITNCHLNPAFVSLLGESQLTQRCKRDHGVFNQLNDCVITSLPKHSSTIRAHHVLTT